MAVQFNPSARFADSIPAAAPVARSSAVDSPWFSGSQDKFIRFGGNDAEAGNKPARKGGVLRGIGKGIKYAALSNLITIPLTAIQLLLAPFSAGITLITALKTFFLGPLNAGAIGFIKGFLGR